MHDKINWSSPSVFNDIQQMLTELANSLEESDTTSASRIEDGSTKRYVIANIRNAAEHITSLYARPKRNLSRNIGHVKEKPNA